MARITLVMNDKIVKRLRNKQAEKLKQEEKNVSFSQVVNEELAKSLKVNLND